MSQSNQRTIKRFSLRLLLVVVTAAAAPFAYYTHQDRRRREVAERIERLGGSLTYADSAFSIFRTANLESLTIPQAALESVSNADLRRFPRLDKVVIQDFDCLVLEHRGNWTAPEYPVDAAQTEFLDKLRSGEGVATHDEMMHAKHEDWYKMRLKR